MSDQNAPISEAAAVSLPPPAAGQPAVMPAPTPVRPVGRGAALKEFWYYFSMNSGAVIGLVVFVLLVLVALFAPVVAPFPSDQQFRDALLKPPAWLTEIGRAHV